jgi:uncharacterized FlaG/YvyC family protein
MVGLNKDRVQNTGIPKVSEPGMEKAEFDVSKKPVKMNQSQPAAIFELSSKNTIEENGKKMTEKLQKEATEKVEEREKTNEKMLEDMSEKMNELMELVDGNSLKFKKHDGSGEIVMVLVDKSTEEEVRQVPSELFLTIAGKFREFLEENQQVKSNSTDSLENFEIDTSKSKDAREKAYMSFTAETKTLGSNDE